jgi:hypothetical protein
MISFRFKILVLKLTELGKQIILKNPNLHYNLYQPYSFSSVLHWSNYNKFFKWPNESIIYMKIQHEICRHTVLFPLNAPGVLHFPKRERLFSTKKLLGKLKNHAEIQSMNL